MKVLCLDENGNVTTKESGAVSSEYASSHPVLAAAERIEDECKGWLGYKGMGSTGDTEKDATYQALSFQEFTHMLVAIDDFFTRLIKQNVMTNREKAEIKKAMKLINQNYQDLAVPENVATASNGQVPRNMTQPVAPAYK